MDASAKEQAVRTALANPAVTDAALKAVRTVVADYEAIVRRFPTSAYCDDALWRAGQLSLEAYARFGAADDKAAGIRLLRAVVSAVPEQQVREAGARGDRCGGIAPRTRQPAAAGQSIAGPNTAGQDHAGHDSAGAPACRQHSNSPGAGEDHRDGELTEHRHDPGYSPRRTPRCRPDRDRARWRGADVP